MAHRSGAGSGGAVTAAGLLARCRALGIALAAGEGGALLWEADADPPADLAEALVRHKADVLALLRTAAPGRGPSPVCFTVPTVPWDKAEADGLLAEVQERRRQRFGERGWPTDGAARRRLAGRADAIDAAWLARDLAGLRRAAADYLALLGVPVPALPAAVRPVRG
jgi:hypothetical protein